MNAEDVVNEYKDLLPIPIIEEAKEEIKNRRIGAEKAKEIMERIKQEYENALIDPGEAIGIITAESFGEPSTHNTLNVKHFAGVAEMNVTLGLPRLIEIFDATKNPSTPAMEVYLKKDYSKDPKVVRKIAYKLKETVLKGKEEGLNDLYALREKARTAFISGVKGVTHVLPVKRGNEFVILTAGSNLKDVFEIKEVDAGRVISNDIHEIAKVLGIEAGRQAIINEAYKVISNQGLDVDIRHIMLIADAMTAQGIIRGITRTGLTGEKESVFARASFETPIKHLINAAMTGERDELNSVIENVILNQPVPLGTGLPDLVVTTKESKK